MLECLGENPNYKINYLYSYNPSSKLCLILNYLNKDHSYISR